MPGLPRLWYLFSLAFLLLTLTLGGWVWIFSSHTHHSHAAILDPATKHIYTSVTTEKEVLTSDTGLHTVLEKHLLIPTLGIDAPIEAVGRSVNGTVAGPTQHPWNGVGWYQYGAIPGSRGCTILTGHTIDMTGAPAIFWRLYTIHLGDIVMIEDTTGETLHFRVTHLRIYRPLETSNRNVFGNTSGVFLNLITSASQWLYGPYQPVRSLVVYTTLL
jgi:fermentation-respiration switch protein FrsA (DUF1100 family)